jgi:hypothetical protein
MYDSPAELWFPNVIHSQLRAEYRDPKDDLMEVLHTTDKDLNLNMTEKWI